MWPTRAVGMSSSTASSMPSPALSTGTTTTPSVTRRPSAGPIGVWTRTLWLGMSRVASAASSRLMRTAMWRNVSGFVEASRRVAKRVVDEGMLNQMHGHGSTIRQSAVGSRQSSVTVVSPSRQSESSVRVASPSRQSERRPNAEPEPRAPSPEPRARAPSAEPRPLIESGLLMLRSISVFLAMALAVVSAQQPARRDVSLIVTGGAVVTMDAGGRVLRPGAVAVDGRDIVGVDTPEAIARQFAAGETIDATGQVVMPGLINTHTHAPMVLYRGLADDLALMDWLQKYIFPAEAKTVSPEFVRAGTGWPRSR